MKKRIRIGQLMARVKAGGKALENVPVSSPSRVQDFDGRPPGASVMDEQKVLPSSLPEKRYPCSSQLVGLRRSFVSWILVT
jgi:hypothetical protein